MRIDYEISEQDFINAQRLAIKNSPMRFVRWTRLVFPLVGVGFLAFLANAVVKQGFSIRVLPALIIPLVFIFLPLLNKNTQKKMYAKSTSMQGKLFLEADDAGLQFKGSSFSSQVNWSNFCRFFEDDKSFVLYQNQQIFNIIPKRSLSAGQIANLRQYFEAKIPRRA